MFFRIPENPTPTQATWFLRFFGLTKVRMIFFCWPKVVAIDDQKMVISLPLNWLTKNHMNAMYFGTLAAGADCAAGLVAVHRIALKQMPIQFVFKNMRAEFLKRAEGDVHLAISNIAEVKQLVDRAANTGERVELEIPVRATVPSRLGDEPVAQFVLTLSLKLKATKSQ